MLTKTMTENRFRTLTDAEVEAVSGGLQLSYRDPLDENPFNRGPDGLLRAPSFVELYGLMNLEDQGNGEEIVVTGPVKYALSGDYYARYDSANKCYNIWEDDLFFSDYQGCFVPGTPSNHNFVTKDSSWTIAINFLKSGGSFSTDGGGMEYWLRAPQPTNGQ